MKTCLSFSRIKPIVSDCVTCRSFKQKHIVHMAAQLLAHCLALFSQFGSCGVHRTWFNKSREPLEGDFLLLNLLRLSHTCMLYDVTSTVSVPSGAQSRLSLKNNYSMVSAEQESVAGMLSPGQRMNIQYMCECIVVPFGMKGLHRNPHRDSLRAGDVDTELLYV